MKFDFHCHSNLSDGFLSPQELVDYACERDIQLLALTDHDDVGGTTLMKATIEQRALSLKLVEGVEISAMSDFGEVHIVGLNVDPTNSNLTQALSQQKQQRWQRIEDIDHQLARLGIEGVLAGVKELALQIPTRSHVARVLVDSGYAKDFQQAFKRYIGKKAKVKTAKNWMPLDDAVEKIKQAGGIAILAHPTRYPLSNRKLGYLIEAFAQAGGEALELSYPSLNRDKQNWLNLHREKNQMLASSGSDFHYPDLRWTDLGRFPPLDSQIPHVKEWLLEKNQALRVELSQSCARD